MDERRVVVTGPAAVTPLRIGAPARGQPLAAGASGIDRLTVNAQGVLVPTVNLDTSDPERDLDHVPHPSRPASARAALSSSFGFGGTNAVLAFKRAE